MKTSALLLGLAMAAPLAACSSPADPGAPIEIALACTLPSNCVSTLDGGAPPLHFDGDARHALSRLKRTLAGFPGARIVRSDATAVDTVFTTAVGFQDDVSFRIDPMKQRIDFRSRSRIGLFDFGKNRSRMQEFAERPRWGEHWGDDWQQRRKGWDQWDRRAVPAPAPLPVYQRKYPQSRYPDEKVQQQTIRSENYRYQPREVAARQQYQDQDPKVRHDPAQERPKASNRAAPPKAAKQPEPGAQAHRMPAESPSEHKQPDRAAVRVEPPNQDKGKKGGVPDHGRKDNPDDRHSDRGGN